jgi:hypothetical protein
MKSLDRRLDKVQRKLHERNSPPPRLIQILKTPEGIKLLDGTEPISADQVRKTDHLFVVWEEPLPEHILKQRIITEAHTAALEENASRDAQKREAELGNTRTKAT